MRRGTWSVGLALAGAVCVSLTTSGREPARLAASGGLAAHLPHHAVEGMAVIADRFDEHAAMDLVTFMDQYWREAGNAGFNASIDRVRQRLTASGFEPRQGAGTARPEVWTEEYGKANGWDYSVGTLTLVGQDGQPDEVLLSRERHRVALAINSFSTPPEGLEVPVVDVGDGDKDSDFARADIHGAVVMGKASLRWLWRGALPRGAVGIIGTDLEDYIRPVTADVEAKGLPPRDEWDVLQWGGIPYDEQHRGFGFKATPRAAARIRARLARGPARVRVNITSSFTPGPIRTLVAEIPGTTHPEERIVLAAHIQEPGANDNATGCATQVELARALLAGIRDGRLPAPARTITFLWVDEIRGSMQWMRDHAAEAKSVRYMFALDMTGEDTSKTGGTFLIEKAPDPTAVWNRPSDPHTEWGSGQMKADGITGTLLNDLFLAFCQQRAAGTSWVVRTNPHEGGSDHSPFLRAGIPSLLAWHFPDRFYHSNLDRPGMSSPATMKHVGVSIGATAMFLATAGEQDAASVADLLRTAATARLALERAQGVGLVQKAADRAAAEDTERQVYEAWVKWYGEALDAVLGLPVTAPTASLRASVAAAKQALKQAGTD
jgi:aminopeptidase YwaD